MTWGWGGRRRREEEDREERRDGGGREGWRESQKERKVEIGEWGEGLNSSSGVPWSSDH